MRFLLDTDHISILQRPSTGGYAALRSRMSWHAPGDFGYPIVGFHEQVNGAHSHINHARTSREFVRGYEILHGILRDFTGVSVVPFDESASVPFTKLDTRRMRVGTMDLRIASIALSRGLTLLTRNTTDFDRVPDLVTEDWTS